MSVAATQLQQSFRSSTRQLAGTFARSQQQLNGKKSIETTLEGEKRHVTKKEITTKQLLRQATTVAVTETAGKPENRKNTNNNNRSQGHNTDAILVKELEGNYFDEQERSAGKDYKIYQNGKLNEFFQNESLENPKTVADICLVNDHYILVKMPDRESTTVNYNNLAARRKEFRELKERNANKMENKQKMCRYLRSKRNRITKIAPIHEEPEDLSDTEKKTESLKSNCLKIQSCWRANDEEVESYQTQTRIFKKMPPHTRTICDHQNTAQISSSPKLIAEKAEKPPDIQTISGSLLKSSLQYQVSLHKYGSLIESKNTNKLNTMEIINSPRRRKCLRLENFYWLLRPFRGKHRKSKPKIQAVVYKTYFVKWTKPPDTLTHGYGVKSLNSSHDEMSILRRCRSAIF